MSDTADQLQARYAGRVGAFSLDAEFAVPLRGLSALFGPSGCGKTTLLRCIAGLTRLPGRLALGGELWDDAASGLFRPPHARAIGYVFQEANLFAHLCVRDNLLYGHRRALRAGVEETLRPADVIALLGLGPLLGRAPQGLSGGERQRVAVGRALLSQPRLLLLDEPLAALDQAAKHEIFPYLEALQHTLALPILYVSHDLGEVERLAEHMVLLDAGRVLACGPLAQVLTDARLPLARGPAAATVLDARVEAFDAADALSTLRIDGAALLVPGRIAPPGARRRIRIAAGDVSLAAARPSPTTILNVLEARIVEIQPLDAARVNVLIALGPGGDGARLLARITRRSLAALSLAAGQRIHAQLKAVSIVDPQLAAALESAETEPSHPW